MLCRRMACPQLQAPRMLRLTPCTWCTPPWHSPLRSTCCPSSPLKTWPASGPPAAPSAASILDHRAFLSSPSSSRCSPACPQCPLHSRPAECAAVEICDVKRPQLKDETNQGCKQTRGLETNRCSQSVPHNEWLPWGRSFGTPVKQACTRDSGMPTAKNAFQGCKPHPGLQCSALQAGLSCDGEVGPIRLRTGPIGCKRVQSSLILSLLRKIFLYILLHAQSALQGLSNIDRYVP